MGTARNRHPHPRMHCIATSTHMSILSKTKGGVRTALAAGAVEEVDSFK